MGITIVEKSKDAKRRTSKRALILAGGAVTGGSFMAGGIKALNDYFDNFQVNDFDIFVGISSGSLLASALMAGISPESIVKSLDGTSAHFSTLTAWHYYRPNFEELIKRPLAFLTHAAGWFPRGFTKLLDDYPNWTSGILGRVWRFLSCPNVKNYENLMQPIMKIASSKGFPSLFELFPTGLFDNRPIEQYMRQNIEINGLTNNFAKAQRLTKKKLYISAMRLDGAKRVVFGHDENDSLTISEAVWASTALPGFYKPANINGYDYVDGGVQESANIDIAVKKGADLIVLYNPFRPFEPKEFVDGMARKIKAGKSLASEGIGAVFNQILRAFFYSRLKVAVDGFKNNKRFNGDIILIEPRPDDEAFFSLNPLLLKNRIEAARLGFESARNSINANFAAVSRVMNSHGIVMSKKTVEKKFKKFSNPKVSEEQVQKLLEGKIR